MAFIGNILGPGRRRFVARRSADDGYTRSPVLAEPEVTLSPDEIVLNLDANNRHQAIERAAVLLAASRNLDAALVFRALWRREQAGSTALGMGIAIPHARVAGITTPAVLFARTEKPIEFRAPDGNPVFMLYVMLVPADGQAEEHLRRLAMVAQTFSDPVLRESLAGLSEPSAIQRAFADAESRMAAAQATAARDRTETVAKSPPDKQRGAARLT